MKNIYISAFVFLAAFNTSTKAQCVVNETEDNIGVYPSELPTVCVSSNYSESATVVGFRDTVYGGFTVPIDSMKINSVFGLPSGLNWACGVSDCTNIPTNSEPPRVCFSVDGTVATEFQQATIGVEIIQSITIFGFPVDLTDTLYTTIGSSSVDTSVTVAGMTLISAASNATYQWLDCDNAMNPIPNETSPSYTSAVAGSFAVEVTQGSCTLVSDCYSVGGLGLNDRVVEPFFSVFPNPSSSKVNIQVKENMNVKTLNIIGVDGRMVSDIQMNSMRGQTVTFSLSRGVYLAQAIREDGQMTSQRIVVTGE
ncbi:MAG: T9SS type A sorting domain-containing protein [Flavobacteriales bacterium]|nr:T9SS type A sorting domain-containing protein [Flavobacteriales bacterium]